MQIPLTKWYFRWLKLRIGVDLQGHSLKWPSNKERQSIVMMHLVQATIWRIILIGLIVWAVFYLYASLGIVYYNEGQYQKAIPHLQRLVDYPFIPGTKLMLADSYIETGKYRNGAELYGKTFGAHSRDYYNYGLALYKQGKISEARAQWKFIVDCLPESDAKPAAAEALKSLSK